MSEASALVAQPRQLLWRQVEVKLTQGAAQSFPTAPADGPQTCMGAPRRAHTQPWRFPVAYGVTMARVTTLPPSRPSHSAVSKASLILVMGNLWEMTLVRGYLSLVRIRKSMALGMIQGS